MKYKNLYIIDLKNNDLAPIPSSYYDREEEPGAPGTYTREYNTPGNPTCISKKRKKRVLSCLKSGQKTKICNP